MINKRIKTIFILIIVMIIILLAFLFAVYLPSINSNSTSNFDTMYDENSSVIDKHVVLIGKDLSDISEYESVMLFKNMFDSYSNIAFTIYDSEGNINKQQAFLNDILESEIDVVILNPLDYSDTLPYVISLSDRSISVITLGNYTVSPYYTSIGYSPVSTGKLLAKNTLGKISFGSISVIMKSSAYNYSSNIINSFSQEIAKNDSVDIRSTEYLSNLSQSELKTQIELIAQNDRALIVDSHSFEAIYDILLCQSYKGFIYVISKSTDNFAYVLENPNLTFIYQNPELLNEQLFDSLLEVFNNTTEKPHIEARQFVVNIDNIDEYIY